MRDIHDTGIGVFLSSIHSTQHTAYTTKYPYPKAVKGFMFDFDLSPPSAGMSCSCGASLGTRGGEGGQGERFECAM